MADDQLRDRIAAVIRPRMLIGLQDAELYDAPGRERINEWADSIATWAAEIVQPELDQLRAEVGQALADVERIRTREADVRTERREALRERDAARAQVAAARAVRNALGQTALNTACGYINGPRDELKPDDASVTCRACQKGMR